MTCPSQSSTPDDCVLTQSSTLFCFVNRKVLVKTITSILLTLWWTVVLTGLRKAMVVVNLGDQVETVNLKAMFTSLPDKLTIVALSIYSERETG